MRSLLALAAAALVLAGCGGGRLHAHDATSGTPVTNFKRSTTLYNLAMSYNRGLDRDKDGIACEKA